MYRRRECCQCLRYESDQGGRHLSGVVEVHRIWLCLRLPRRLA